MLCKGLLLLCKGLLLLGNEFFCHHILAAAAVPRLHADAVQSLLMLCKACCCCAKPADAVQSLHADAVQSLLLLFKAATAVQSLLLL